jgi:hypothetical protein
MADINPSPLIGNTVNPLTIQNSEYKLPEAPIANAYKGPSTVSQQDVDSLKTQPKTVFGDKIKNLVHTLDTAPAWGADATPYGKVVDYNADYTGSNFQRYYSHSKFKELGFSPFRDNETLYNQKGTWADDAGRMMRGWGNLFATGAYDGIKSWGDNPFNPEADTSTADDMERKMSVMTSSKGGFGGGVINFGANTAYSMGLVTEFMAESAVLAAATAVTFGADIEITAPLEAARAATLATKLGKVGKNMSQTYKTLTALKDLNTAKTFFNSVKAGETLGKALNFINPLENTLEFAKDVNKAMKSGEQVYNMAKASKGIGAFIKDVRQTQMVMSEANLEGGSVQNEMVKQLTNDFYKENGKMPDSEQSADIYKTAQIAGNKTILWNMPALFLSNKIVFENAFKGFKPMRALAAESSEGLAGKLVFNKAWKSAAVNPWSVVDDGFKNSLKSLTKASTWAPGNLAKNLLTKGVGYTSKNLTEAFQEQYQEAVAGSMKEYYTSLYQDPSKAGSDEMGSIFTDNLSKQFTTIQGFETFASGFFMGGVLQGPQKLVFEKIPQKIFKMKNPEEYAKRQQEKKEWTDKVVESLNEVTKNPEKYFNEVSENMVVQKKTGKTMTDANEHNDEKSFKDAADESTFNHLHTVINSGKFELVLQHLHDMKQLSPDELEEAFGSNPDKINKSFYINKIDSLINRANEIKGRTDKVNEQFVNPFNPYKFNPGTDTKNFIDEQIRWRAYEDAKKTAIYSQYSFDRTLNRMQDIIKDVTNDIPVSKANMSDFSLLFNTDDINSEINALDVEIKAYSEGTSEQKSKAKKSAKKRAALESLRENIKHHQAGLKDRNDAGKSAVRSNATAIKPKMKVKINTEAGGTGVVEKIVGKYAILTDGKKIHRKNLEPLDKKNIETKDHIDDSLETLYESYKDYLRVIADINKDHVFDDKVNSSFSKLKDFYSLEADSNDLAGTVNFLHNPSSFVEYSRRMEEIRRSLYERRADHMRAALEEYLKIKDQNELLNQLLEDGVYIHPDDVKALLNNKIVPKELFDVITYEELTPSSEKYKKGLESITKWIEATKPVEETAAETTDAVEPVTEPVDTINVKIKGNTPIYDMPEDLRSELAASFISDNKLRMADGEQPRVGYRDGMSNDEIYQMPSFISFVKTFSKPAKIISEYNTKHNRTVEPVIVEPVKKEEPKVATVSLIITKDMRQQLSDLGYSKEDIDKMRPAQANHLISGNITKPVKALTPEEDIEARRKKEFDDLNEKLLASGRADEPISDTKRKQINDKYDAELAALNETPEAIKSIEESFNEATTIEELEAAENEVLAVLADPEQRRELNLTNEFIVNLIESKKRELALSFTYESIQPGDVIIMTNDDKMLVVEKTDTQLKLRKFGDETENNNVIVPKDLVATTVKYKYKEGMENVSIKTPVTPQEVEVSNQSVKNFTEFNEDDDADIVDEDMAKATNMTKEDRNDDLINNLGCK